jgi:hypothetical protein
MKRILITAPLRQDADIFEAYQQGLDALEVPEGYAVDRFFVVNDCEDVIPQIRNAKYIRADTGDEYLRTGNDHLWTMNLMAKMSTLRNITILEMLDGGYDYWLSIDTDIVVDPRTLRVLLKADKDIVSEIFWTESPSGKLWCNAWLWDQYGVDDEHFREWKRPGLYRCGMTGALTLVKRRVFEAGVNYTRIPNINTALKGEDRHFCVRAACAGFELWIDSHCPARHLYTRQLYNDYMAGR